MAEKKVRYQYLSEMVDARLPEEIGRCITKRDALGWEYVDTAYVGMGTRIIYRREIEENDN